METPYVHLILGVEQLEKIYQCYQLSSITCYKRTFLCSTRPRSHDAGSMSVLNFTFIIVVNIYHGQNVSSNHNETLTVTCSHSAKMVEFRYGFKLLQLALRSQTWTQTCNVDFCLYHNSNYI